MSLDRISVSFEYSRRDFCDILGFLDRHAVEKGGRYMYRPIRRRGADARRATNLRAVTVYTHPPKLPATAGEAMVMCRYRLHCRRLAVTHIAAAPAFDFDTAWLELAVIEKAAFGHALYGDTPHDS